MDTAPFQTIPAWRIARLRTALRDAQLRGADPQDDGADLEHPALRRRFARGRQDGKTRKGPARRPKTTRKGRRFPAAKQAAIWRAILATRPPGWTQGDPAPFGSIRRAHQAAVAACREDGLTPPRYRTVYVLWHRGVPTETVLAALRSADADEPPVADM